MKSGTIADDDGHAVKRLPDAEAAFVTPISLMVHAASAVTRAHATQGVMLEHLRDASAAHAAAVTQLGHEIASIWLEPHPLGSMATVIKAERTRAVLIRHWRDAGTDGVRRFQALLEQTTFPTDQT